MVEIHSAKELADSLLNAGDRLVIIDFYSPGCGGCRTLHPKVCYFYLKWFSFLHIACVLFLKISFFFSIFADMSTG